MEKTFEKNGSIDNPSEWRKSPTRMTSVNFDAYLHEEARNQGIALRDAIEFGIKFLIADAEGVDYPECNLMKRLQKVTQMLQAKSNECEALRDQINKDDEE